MGPADLTVRGEGRSKRLIRRAFSPTIHTAPPRRSETPLAPVDRSRLIWLVPPSFQNGDDGAGAPSRYSARSGLCGLLVLQTVRPIHRRQPPRAVRPGHVDPRRAAHPDGVVPLPAPARVAAGPEIRAPVPSCDHAAAADAPDHPGPARRALHDRGLDRDGRWHRGAARGDLSDRHGAGCIPGGVRAMAEARGHAPGSVSNRGEAGAAGRAGKFSSWLNVPPPLLGRIRASRWRTGYAKPRPTSGAIGRPC